MMNSLINNTDTTDRRSAESNPKVSVILPIYNVEPYIGKCIDSLKAQNLDGLEFIFVDDCSTDGSMEPVKTWAAEDERVRILKNEKNLGAGPSRNRGIEAARGEFLSFIDPDDWISENFYESLYIKAKETDCNIVKGRREYVDESGKPLSAYEKADLNKRIVTCLQINRPLHSVFACEHQSAIYKASFIKQNDIRYGNSRKSQDVTFLLRVCTKTQDIQITNEATYYYFRKRSQSMVNNFSSLRAEGEVEALRERMDILLSDNPDQFALKCIQRDIRTALTSLYYAYKKEVDTEKISSIKQQLREQIHRMDGQAAIQKSIPELSAFMKDEYLIPVNKTSCSDILFSDRAERWVDYLKLHQNSRQLFALQACASAFTYSWLYYVKAKISGKGGAPDYLSASWKEIKKQWQHLDKDIKCKVSMHIPQVAIGYVLRKVVNH